MLLLPVIMKKIALSALLAATLVGASSFSSAPAPTARAAKVADKVYKVQPQLSTLGWDAKAITHGHNGTAQFSNGELIVRGNQLVGGDVTVDMKSLKATDITDTENNAKFMGHMNSDDFFSTDKYATATFKIMQVTGIKGAAADANNATITGDLTIKGITNSISFPAKVGVKGGKAAASGTATVDRTKYNIKYGSKSFFEGIGDKAIYDEFKLSFNVIAM